MIKIDFTIKNKSNRIEQTVCFIYGKESDMNKKVKVLRCIGVLGLAAILSTASALPSVQASEKTCTDSTDTKSRESGYVDNEIPPEMEDFYEHMQSGEELQEGEERALGTVNGEEFGVTVTDVTEK